MAEQKFHVQHHMCHSDEEWHSLWLARRDRLTGPRAYYTRHPLNKSHETGDSEKEHLVVLSAKWASIGLMGMDLRVLFYLPASLNQAAATAQRGRQPKHILFNVQRSDNSNFAPKLVLSDHARRGRFENQNGGHRSCLVVLWTSIQF